MEKDRDKPTFRRMPCNSIYFYESAPGLPRHIRVVGRRSRGVVTIPFLTPQINPYGRIIYSSSLGLDVGGNW